MPAPAPSPSARWHHHTFPGKKASAYRSAHKAGRSALAAQADGSASMLRQRLDLPPESLGALRFSWYVPALIDAAVLGTREADDSPVRIVLAFEGDRSRLSARDAMLSELSQTLTGEPMPYATLMYVWCKDCAQGEVIGHVRTGRIRKIAVESGSARLNRWLDYERDVRADYERAFGEPPGRLGGIGLMTDADNTRSTAQAWYGPLTLLPPAVARNP
ncbi:DUF3047 domain-containing protein [Ramlibacter rhizophilus]|uniref:DUF3047 domain-containing protein n=2 Tax=Ramlibacter rhizophilus TaxID=1781167 RepID=A0A4Z0BFT5_9BURK|nr:DUF3047 domain-containing protein [Ramlibacter rhizophilus]